MTIKVVHWGTGATGSLALGAVMDRRDFELVGHYVWNADKAGRDSGELIGRSPVGVKASRDMDALIGLKPDVLTYFGNGVRDRMQSARDIARFLGAGVNVVTSSLAAMTSPDTADPEMVTLLKDACEKGGSSLFASGIDPGFATTHLSLTSFAGANRVDRVRLQEFADYGVYPDEQTGRYLWGFGLPLDTETMVSRGDLLRSSWTGTVVENARALGWEIEDFRTTCFRAPASRDYDTAIGRIEKGTLSAIWFQLIGLVGGEEKIVLEHINWIGVDDVPADWPMLPRYKGEISACSYRTVIEGDPAFDVELQMAGDHAGLSITALHPINAIPMVVKAAPGIVAQADFVPYGVGKLKT